MLFINMIRKKGKYMKILYKYFNIKEVKKSW